MNIVFYLHILKVSLGVRSGNKHSVSIVFIVILLFFLSSSSVHAEKLYLLIRLVLYYSFNSKVFHNGMYSNILSIPFLCQPYNKRKTCTVKERADPHKKPEKKIAAKNMAID